MDAVRRKQTQLNPRFHVMLVGCWALIAVPGGRCLLLLVVVMRRLWCQSTNNNTHLPTPPLSVQTTYDVVIRDVAVLKRFDWSAAVIDEGHSLKGPGSLRGRALRELGAPWRMLLTGTPLQVGRRVLGRVGGEERGRRGAGGGSDAVGIPFRCRFPNTACPRAYRPVPPVLQNNLRELLTLLAFMADCTVDEVERRIRVRGWVPRGVVAEEGAGQSGGGGSGGRS